MAEIYGHKWTSAYGEDSGQEGAAGTWAKGLAGITPRQIADGLNACLTSSDAWPPTLPEFRGMCLGIPSLALVRIEIRSGDHCPFTRAVWANLDSYRFKLASTDASDRLLREAYELTREQVMRGQPLPEPSRAIEQEAHEFKPASPGVAEAARAKIAAMLRTGLRTEMLEPTT